MMARREVETPFGTIHVAKYAPVPDADIMWARQERLFVDLGACSAHDWHGHLFKGGDGRWGFKFTDPVPEPMRSMLEEIINRLDATA
jgi:hypothetical protein